MTANRKAVWDGELPLLAGKSRWRTVPPPPTRHDPLLPAANGSSGAVRLKMLAFVATSPHECFENAYQNGRTNGRQSSTHKRHAIGASLAEFGLQPFR